MYASTHFFIQKYNFLFYPQGLVNNASSLLVSDVLKSPSIYTKHILLNISFTHPCSLHLHEDSSLEGFFPQCQLCTQLHTEAVALAVTHQHTKAEPLAVPQLTVLLQAHTQLWLNPAVFSYTQLCRETRPTHYTPHDHLHEQNS